MCSELTPRAHIPDTRIPQLMQPCLTKALILSIELSDTLYLNEPPDPTLKEYLHLTTDQPGPKIRFCLNHRTHPLPLKSPSSIGSLCIYPPNLFLLPKLFVYSPLGQACQLGLPLRMEGRIPLKQIFGWTTVVALWFSTWNFWS